MKKEFKIKNLKSGHERIVTFEGLATKNGAQILFRFAPLQLLYKIHTKSGCGIAEARSWVVEHTDLDMVRSWARDIVRKQNVAEELRKPL